MVFGEENSTENAGAGDTPNANETTPSSAEAPAMTRRELRERERRAAEAAAESGDNVVDESEVVEAEVVVESDLTDGSAAEERESVDETESVEVVALEDATPEADAGAEDIEDAVAVESVSAQDVPAASKAIKHTVQRKNVAAAVAAPAAKAGKGKSNKLRTLASGAVMTLAAGLVATMALPSYAFNTKDGFDANAATAPLSVGQQSVTVAESASAGTVSRDGYQAPTEDDLARARAAEAAAAAAAAAVTRTGSPSNSGFVPNPPSGPYSGQAVVEYAKQFVGVVPYGTGNTPDTSFSCDGLTQYVFAQFGISLPRMVSNQAARGIRIAPEDAQAGDLVVWPIGHIGIYDGSGGVIDSPDWGRKVVHRGLWGSYYFVRIV